MSQGSTVPLSRRGVSISINMIRVACLLGLVSLCYGGIPICSTTYEEKCWDEPREHCTTVQKPHTTTVYEQVCHTVQVPKVDTVPEEKCKEFLNRSVKPSMKKNVTM